MCAHIRLWKCKISLKALFNPLDFYVEAVELRFLTAGRRCRIYSTLTLGGRIFKDNVMNRYEQFGDSYTHLYYQMLCQHPHKHPFSNTYSASHSQPLLGYFRTSLRDTLDPLTLYPEGWLLK